jgi:hypothetical protein
MNGCQYTHKRFSAPASWHTEQITWDYAFLSKTEFMAKYAINERGYEELDRPQGLVSLADIQ